MGRDGGGDVWPDGGRSLIDPRQQGWGAEAREGRLGWQTLSRSSHPGPGKTPKCGRVGPQNKESPRPVRQPKKKGKGGGKGEKGGR